jgi:hypothetical protein
LPKQHQLLSAGAAHNIMLPIQKHRVNNNSVAQFYFKRTITWSLSTVVVKSPVISMTMQCGGAMRCASPNGGYLGLHSKTLGATIGRVHALYCPGGRHPKVINFRCKHNTLTKHNF